ncbi:22121_t:CDS:10 [Cetraspora pellucida]|uniref:DNA polymerase lambda n=1 Tax=Cetraspora pellucida TaxID=1433469 RepID=A0A9N9CNR1_9GLOM|nr:22121_t:CDS:10 [Cetraspora pellucida]
MASEDEGDTRPTNSNTLSMLSESEDLMLGTPLEPSVDNDIDKKENPQTSLQLSNSFYSGMDSLNILSSQENDTLMNADQINVKNKKRTFDSISEEKPDESHVISNDTEAPVSKKIDTKTSSAADQTETQKIQLSSFSFKPVKRKTRKVMYKITNEKEVASSSNKKARYDSSVHASQSTSSQTSSQKKSSQKTSSQKTTIVASGPSKTTRGRKKKSTRETASSKNARPTLSLDGIFSNFRFFFIPKNIDKVRLRLLKEKVVERGGQVIDGEFDISATHVITALQGQRVLKALGIRGNNIPQKRKQESLSPEKRSPFSSFSLQEVSALTYESSPTVSKVTSDDDPLIEMIAETKHLVDEGFLLDDYDDESQSVQGETSDSENEMIESSTQNEEVLSQSQEVTSELSTKEANSFKGQFTCMHKHTYGEDDASPNKLIIDKLKVLLDHYLRMKDEWRILSYRKAIAAIKRQKEPITSYQEAIEIRGIGHRTAEKIAEIVNTGNLKRLQHFSKDDEVIKKFSDIHGVGPSIAMKWYAKGYRTFDDIIQNVKLTRAQRIGIECYDDLQERIPRDEITEISKRVEVAACKIDPKLLCITVGSYIRGQPTCGDIDILITRNDSDGKSSLDSFLKLLDALREQGLLTHDLTQHNEEKASSRYLGICKLPDGKYRRIDLFIVPFNELGAALLSFTGNDIFNRSMRLLARKQKMKLNNHGLYKNISRGRGGVSLTEGTLVAQRTEREIFDALGVPWRPPNERNC